MPRKILLIHCMECKLEPIVIRMKPTGYILKDGTGYCVECYEKAVRKTGATGRKPTFEDTERQVLAVF